MAARSSMLHVRVDDDTKEKANLALKSMGLTVSDAVRLFLHRIVVEQAMPFDLRVPNAETRAAMIEANEIAETHRARFRSADELFPDLEDSDRR